MTNLYANSLTNRTIRNHEGFTALHYASYHGYEAVVFLLLDAGAGTSCHLNCYFVHYPD